MRKDTWKKKLLKNLTNTHSHKRKGGKGKNKNPAQFELLGEGWNCYGKRNERKEEKRMRNNNLNASLRFNQLSNVLLVDKNYRECGA